jgi:ABC-2 type transport system ATP-binding protein
MSVIEVEGLRKSYGEVHAVRGISFSVDAGECVAVLGPNGAGKTTTIEMLEGFRPADAGTVRVLGEDPALADSKHRERMGIVLQECGIDPYLTVTEVLRMHASYYPHPRSVDDTIAMVGLDEKRDSRVKALSGGQQRRLDVALGIVGDPELLFLDEPTTGFDPSARRQAWELVHSLRGLGKTVLLTTHYMDEAQSLADRVIVIAEGQIIAEGSPDTIGGRATAATQIRFLWPDVQDAAFPLDATRDGAFALISTEQATAVLHQLTTWATDRGIELEGLTVTKPTLEDVYLGLIGEQP